jgi:hypothetical protein
MKARDDSHDIPPPRISWHSAMEPEVIQTSVKGKTDKPKVKGKRAVYIGLVVIALIILASMGLYSYVLPRVDVELVTVYHESTGGVASSGSINLNTQIRNEGTKKVEDLNVSIIISDPDTGEVQEQLSDSFNSISRGDKKEPRMEFFGDHYEPYKVTIMVSFQSSGKAYIREYIYNIEKDDAMNLIFEERIFEWRF